jgi:deazaflavin-dependent oxidoreductase (nitroreductase family)
MRTVQNTLMRYGSKLAVALYRRTGGRVGGKGRGGTPVLLLTVPGRKSGLPRTAAVGYFEHEEGWLVVGSAGGLPQDPQWFSNLRRVSTAEVEIGHERRRVAVRELKGEERDAAWRDIVVAQNPAYAPYEKKTSRTIPLAVLSPITASE